MAQFTAQGRLKLLYHGDGMPIGSEAKSTNRQKNQYYKLLGAAGHPMPLPFHKRKLMLSSYQGNSNSKDSSTRRFSASQSSSSSSTGETDSHLKSSVRGESILLGDDGGELESDDELSCFRGLVLDIAYRPVNVVCWKRAICLEFMEKADVLEYYDQTINSPSGSFYIPAVLRVPHLLQVVKRRRIRNTLSRKNIFYRDNFSCQYCSSRENLTIDHVQPVARGGKWKWENLVTACSKCNSKKGQKTLEEANMKLLKVPKAPKDYDILAIPLTNSAIRMLRMRKGTPEEWRLYLSKSSFEP